MNYEYLIMNKDIRKAVFFDRDGTINSDLGHYYVYRKEDFVFNKGVIDGMKSLHDAGFLLFIVTNQGGVAKGIYSCDDVEKLHDYMLEQLREKSVSIENIYYCPHHESVSPCECRKPSPYFINKAIRDYQLDKEMCFMIGDSQRDVESANIAGIKAYKIIKNTSIKWCVDDILKRSQI